MDYIVNLSRLSEYEGRQKLGSGIVIRRALVPEGELIQKFARENFSQHWSSETAAAMTRQPVSCFVAIRGKELLGFAVYDAVSRGFFGPIGVDERERRNGIGHALLMATLRDMANVGYGYAIIGWASSVAFYEKSAGAKLIENSDVDIFNGIL